MPSLRCVKCKLFSFRQGSKIYIFVSWTGSGFCWVGQTPLPLSTTLQEFSYCMYFCWKKVKTLMAYSFSFQTTVSVCGLLSGTNSSRSASQGRQRGGLHTARSSFYSKSPAGGQWSTLSLHRGPLSNLKHKCTSCSIGLGLPDTATVLGKYTAGHQGLCLHNFLCTLRIKI